MYPYYLYRISFDYYTTIIGEVVLDLDKPTKTNCICVTLNGEVYSDGSTTTVLSETWYLATSPENDGKPYILEAQQHHFPFEFTIPTSGVLPSAVQISPSISVKYTLTAYHDRPYVFFEKFGAQVKQDIRILERIDITQPEYCAKGRVYDESQVFGSNDPRKVQSSVVLPRYAIVRGDILPIEISIKHYKSITQEEGIKLYLIRRVYDGKNKRKLLERKSIKSSILGINIPDESTSFGQEIKTKLLIPSITPPTIEHNNLKIEYSLRVVVNINGENNKHQENYVNLESSIIIGTYPKPDLCIDDDDDEEEVENGNEIIENEDIEPLAEEQDVVENADHVEKNKDDDKDNNKDKNDTNNKINYSNDDAINEITPNIIRLQLKESNSTNSTSDIEKPLPNPPSTPSSHPSISTISPSTPTSSATIIDPTFKRESSISSIPDKININLHRHATSGATMTVSSPEKQLPSPGVRRTQSSFTPSSSENICSSSSSNTATTIQPSIVSPLNKQHSYLSSNNDQVTATSGMSYQSPPMAKMPDISSYVPPKSSSPHLPSGSSSPVFLCNTTAHLDDQPSPSFPQPLLSTSPSMITPIPVPNNSYSNNTNNYNSNSYYNDNNYNNNNSNNSYYNGNNYNNNNSNGYYNNNNNNNNSINNNGQYQQYNQPSYPYPTMPQAPQPQYNNHMNMNNNPQHLSGTFSMPDHAQHLPFKQQAYSPYPSQPSYPSYPAQSPYPSYSS
ncbi:unnamed protein product [Cunninghamella blakesleeana]